MPDVNGVHYHDWANPIVIEILERLRHDHERGVKERIYLHYGDRLTGLDWMELKDVTGYVSYSTGSRPVPILQYNSRSGGTPILTECIVKIDGLWVHPRYHLNPDQAQGMLAAIGEQAFMRHFGIDELKLVQLRATLLKITAPSVCNPPDECLSDVPTNPQPKGTTWPTSQA